MAIQFGNTWWGKQWLNAFDNIDNSNRLPRGRSYARNGSVRDFVCNQTVITGKVQGSSPKPYKIQIEISRFSDADKRLVVNTITENPAFLGKLLSRELPPELKDALLKKSIHLFPSSWRDMKATCSCPDYAVPCKHIAAIIYLIANEIDKNPFLVFELHGMDVLAAIEAAGYSGAQQATNQVPSVQEILTSLLTEVPSLEPEPSLLSQLDFSTIPDCRTELLSLLTPNPLFYSEGDFKKILEKNGKGIHQQASLALKVSEDEEKKPTQAAQTVFPERVTAIEIVLNDTMACTDIRLHTLHEIITWNGRNRSTPIHQLTDWLAELPIAQTSHYHWSVRALLAVHRLSLLLLRQGAVIPQIIHLDEGNHAVHWQPAVLKEEVQQVVDALAKALPSNLLQVAIQSGKKKAQQNVYFPAEMQVTQLLSLLLTHFIHQTNAGKPADELIAAFFHGSVINTSARGHKETPSLIYLWLKRFYLSKKTTVPIIKIEAGESTDFMIDLLVSQRDKSIREPIVLRDIFSKAIYNDIKISLIQDLSVLTEYFPRLNTIISSQGKEKLLVNGDEFAQIFLGILPVMRLLGISVLLPKSLQKMVRPNLSMAIDSEGKGVEKHFLKMDELLQYKWQVALGDEQISPEEFKKMVKGLSGIVKIRDQYVIIDSQEMQALLKKLENPPSLKSTEVLQIALAEEYAGAGIQLSAKAKRVLKELMEVKKVALPDGLQATLRPYQVRGFEWLYKNSRIGFGSILADDMGLGKTLQIITTLLKFKQEGYLTKKKSLVIVPTTLLTNWQKEVNRFAPSLKVHVFHGPNRKMPDDGMDILLTTYGTARTESEKLSQLKWYVIVIDEAQNIKNPGTAQTKAIKKLKSDIQIAMSGTPVENRLSEYWSLMDFTNKGYLGSLKHFQTTFAYPIEVEQDQHQLQLFHKSTSPFLMRRVKSDKSIINDLPDKIETDEYCSLMPEQAALYQTVVEDIMKQVEESEGIERRGLIFKLIMALKQICNHPAQFLKKELADPDLSGKTAHLLTLLDDMHETHDKVLIFTQFQQMGELLQQLIQVRYPTEALFLHGGCSRKQRDEMVEQFQTQPAVTTMILSLKAGGTGLNLTAASRVIHYDLWWNPAVEAQATDRAYRIGQKKNVFVHRLLTQGTFEEKINQMLQEKRDLASLAVAQGEQWIGELPVKDLKKIFSLEKG
ncbi:MAG: DEAD/DEAH box helicase [Bacteroidota bacterium]